MHQLRWDDRLAVGEARIDADHRALVDEVATLAASLAAGADAASLADVLIAVELHVVAHFDYEEQEMVRTGYDAYALHKGQHDRFVGEFLDWKAGLDRDGPTETVRAAFERRIAGWLVEHILRADRVLGEHLAVH